MADIAAAIAAIRKNLVAQRREDLQGHLDGLEEQLEALREEIIAVRADCGICNGGVTEADHHRGICPNCGHLWRLIDGDSNPASEPEAS